jgi:hypothetical protein
MGFDADVGAACLPTDDAENAAADQQRFYRLLGRDDRYALHRAEKILEILPILDTLVTKVSDSRGPKAIREIEHISIIVQRPWPQKYQARRTL